MHGVFRHITHFFHIVDEFINLCKMLEWIRYSKIFLNLYLLGYFSGGRVCVYCQNHKTFTKKVPISYYIRIVLVYICLILTSFFLQGNILIFDILYGSLPEQPSLSFHYKSVYNVNRFAVFLSGSSFIRYTLSVMDRD